MTDESSVIQRTHLISDLIVFDPDHTATFFLSGTSFLLFLSVLHTSTEHVSKNSPKLGTGSCSSFAPIFFTESFVAPENFILSTTIKCVFSKSAEPSFLPLRHLRFETADYFQQKMDARSM